MNSVAIGLRVRIKTLRHALMVLGQEQLKRWITLALYASDESSGAQSPLLEMAAMRGKLMELLVAVAPQPGGKELPERAFMAGILSADRRAVRGLHGRAGGKLNLVDDVRDALLERGGLREPAAASAEKLGTTPTSAAVNQHLDECAASPWTNCWPRSWRPSPGPTA